MQDGWNCGVYMIANALAVAMCEAECGKIDPSQWQIWLATEVIEKGRRDSSHGHEDILSGLPDEWEMCLGQRKQAA